MEMIPCHRHPHILLEPGDGCGVCLSEDSMPMVFWNDQGQLNLWSAYSSRPRPWARVTGSLLDNKRCNEPGTEDER